MERKGRQLVGRGRPVNDSVNDFCSSLSGGQSPRAAANQGPRWAVTQQPLLSGGPPSPVSPWEPGSGGQVPGRRPFCPERPVFLPNSLLGPASGPGTLCQAPSGSGAGQGQQVGLGSSPSALLEGWLPGVPSPRLCSHSHCCFPENTSCPPTPVVLGVGDKGMSQLPPSPPAALRTEGGGAGTGVPRGPGWA